MSNYQYHQLSMCSFRISAFEIIQAWFFFCNISYTFVLFAMFQAFDQHAKSKKHLQVGFVGFGQALDLSVWPARNSVMIRSLPSWGKSSTRRWRHTLLKLFGELISLCIYIYTTHSICEYNFTDWYESCLSGIKSFFWKWRSPRKKRRTEKWRKVMKAPSSGSCEAACTKNHFPSLPKKGQQKAYSL